MFELRIATRQSSLALAQASRVAELLVRAHPEVEVSLVEVETTGDKDRTTGVALLTQVGAFVRSVQQAVIDGRADFAVHSLKDLPVSAPAELVLAAFPERASPYDVLVGSCLANLKAGALVGTGSPRRVAQLLDLRPDLRTAELRGNVDTRLSKVGDGQVDAAVLAEAGVDRLGMSDAISQRLSLDEMVPAPGQGALAVEALRGTVSAELVQTLDDPRLRVLLSAERGLLAETGAGCRSALGALAEWDGPNIRLNAFVADERGHRRAVATGDTPAAVVDDARRQLGI